MARIIKHMVKSYLPETIHHLNREYKLFNWSHEDQNKSFSAIIQNKRFIVLTVKNSKLKGKFDIHGDLYPESEWLFIAD